MSETELDEQYERAEKRAEELTEQNRAALQAKAQTDPELAKLAMEEWLENVSLRSIAETLWECRQDQLNDLAPWLVDRTTLALQFKAAAEQYARDNAVKVRAQTLLDAENDNEGDDDERE